MNLIGLERDESADGFGTVTKTEPPAGAFAYMNLIDLVKVMTVLMALVP